MTANSDLIIYQENELYGLKDCNGNVIISPQYKEMYPFSCGLSLVRDNDYCYAYINVNNQPVVPFGKYSWCDPEFVCGCARVLRYNIEKGKNEWGIIDTQGNAVVPIKYDRIWTLKEEYLHSVKAFIDDKEIDIDLSPVPPVHVAFDGLKYLVTYTVEEFKAVFNCVRICVKRNPETGELFFSYGRHAGYVAMEGIPISPVISVVINNAGSLFLLLHEKEDTGKISFERSISKQQKEPIACRPSNMSWKNNEEDTIDSDPYGYEQAYYDGWFREDVESGLADAYEGDIDAMWNND